MGLQNETAHKLNRRRFDAAIAFKKHSLRSLARALGNNWTGQHIGLVARGERKGSAKLLDAIYRELGEAAWRFATGQTDTLQDEVASHGA